MPAATTTFSINATTLARAIANAAKRERQRAARLADDAADVALGRGDLDAGKALAVLAESIRSTDTTVIPATDPADLGDGDRDYHRIPDELPPVRHSDDFEDGAALVRIGADRRGVVGYGGASGHLRD